jgi:hypothetical protein
MSIWRYWLLGHKLSFNGTTRTIYIAPHVTDLVVKSDIYSDWKEWQLVDDNPKYIPAIRTAGGDYISETQQLGDSYFLINGWKIKPWSGDYTLRFDGNLYVDTLGDDWSEDPTNLDPFVAADTGSNIKIQWQVSSLVNTVKYTDTEQVPALTAEQLTLFADILTQATAANVQASQANVEATKARKMGTNLAIISADGLLVTIYDDDGTTILHQFNTSSDENNVHTREPL